MELIIAVAVIMGLLVLLDLSALIWGADSRRTTSDWKPQPESETFE